MENPDTPGPRQLEMTVLMTPDSANFSGKVHGGHLLNHLDQVAYSCASLYSGKYVVTLMLDDAIFREPVHVGELVTFKASVNYVGTTSMEIGIRVVAENHRTRLRRHVMSCFFVMIAMDEDGRPTPVPQFEPDTDEEKRRWKEAKERRAIHV
jgi:acyl-CoA hydrolase